MRRHDRHQASTLAHIQLRNTLGIPSQEEKFVNGVHVIYTDHEHAQAIIQIYDISLL